MTFGYYFILHILSAIKEGLSWSLINHFVQRRQGSLEWKQKNYKKRFGDYIISSRKDLCPYLLLSTYVCFSRKWHDIEHGLVYIVLIYSYFSTILCARNVTVLFVFFSKFPSTYPHISKILERIVILKCSIDENWEKQLQKIVSHISIETTWKLKTEDRRKGLCIYSIFIIKNFKIHFLYASVLFNDSLPLYI